MKKSTCLIGLFLMNVFWCVAQDEGVITKKERIDRSAGIFISGGPSFTFGKNIGDYSKGFNVEAGFLTRLNRVISIGPSISYINFKYDPKKTGINNVFLSDEYYDGSYYYKNGLYVDFSGGDLSLLSLSFTLKLNFIPVKDDSKISLYAFAKPFVTMANRDEVVGKATIFTIYDYDDSGSYDELEIQDGIDNSVVLPWEAGDPTWATLGVQISDDLKKDSQITGGIFIGPGIEFNPAKNVSFYFQTAVGYTFPVSFISTKKYEGNDLDTIDEKYPITKEGFPSLNIQLGFSFNF